jgi:hypothetical protein
VDILYAPAERLDHVLSAPLDRAPLLAILLLAALLGLRHALDPDHLVAVSSLVAARCGDVRGGIRIGAWWGAGHAATLLLVGIPLIAMRAALPAWVEGWAERAIGVVIVLLGLRLLWRWRRSDVRLTRHAHPPAPPHRHVHHPGAGADHGHQGRAPGQALCIGALHGLAGSGAVVVLLLASLEDVRTMLVALALFATMSVVSMALCTGGFAWALTRSGVGRAAERVLVPALALFGIWFGVMYAAI